MYNSDPRRSRFATALEASAVALGVGLACYATAWLGLKYATVNTSATLLWAPTGIAAAVFYRRGLRSWPAVWLAAFAIHLKLCAPIAAAGIACGNTLAPLLVARLLRRNDFHPKFRTGRDVVALIIAGMLGVAISALNGVVWLWTSDLCAGARMAETALVWWLGDVSGIIVVAPAILACPTWKTLKGTSRRKHHEGELLASCFWLIVQCAVLFGGTVLSDPWAIAFAFLPYVSVIRIAARHGAWAVAVGILIVAASLLVADRVHLAPDRLLPALARPFALWGYLVGIAVVGLCVVGLKSEWDRTRQKVDTGRTQYEALVEDNPALICQFDACGHLLFANDTFRTTFGVDHGMSAATSFFAIAGLQDRAGLIDALLQMEPGDPASTVEYNTVAIDGRKCWLRWTARAVNASGSGHTLFHAVGLDVTEQKFAEDERRQIEARVVQAQRLESVGVLAGGIAHEFNNLLTGVLGHAELAQMLLKPGTDAYNFLDDVRNGANRAAKLTKQLQIYSGASALRTGPIDLSEHVRASLELLAVAVPKRCKLDFELAEGLPLIAADESKLRQLLMSLVSNAGEAVDSNGGSVIVRTVQVPFEPTDRAQWVHVGSLTAGDAVGLQVIDTGGGMAPEILSRAFEPFFTTRALGRGLGLTAVLGIVRDHGGAVGITSRPGYGSTVTVLFPSMLVSSYDDTTTTWRADSPATLPEIPRLRKSASGDRRPAATN